MKTTIKNRIEKASVNLILQELEQNGFVKVAFPEKVYNKVLKHTGIRLIITDCGLKINQQKTLF